MNKVLSGNAAGRSAEGNVSSPIWIARLVPIASPERWLRPSFSGKRGILI